MMTATRPFSLVPTSCRTPAARPHRRRLGLALFGASMVAIAMFLGWTCVLLGRLEFGEEGVLMLPALGICVSALVAMIEGVSLLGSPVRAAAARRAGR